MVGGTADEDSLLIRKDHQDDQKMAAMIPPSYLTEDEMAEFRSKGPYIWTTWLTKLLTGEASCEWAGWFQSQHDSKTWMKVKADYDSTKWQMDHTALLNRTRDRLDDEGYTVSVEGQNSFHLRGKCATLGGKPDLIAVRDAEVLVVDAKSGQPRDSHLAQVILYMYAVKRARPDFDPRMTFRGLVAYPDHDVLVPETAVDEYFISRLSELIKRLASRNPAVKVPSHKECQWCPISSDDCPQRVEGSLVGAAQTEDF